MSFPSSRAARAVYAPTVAHSMLLLLPLPVRGAGAGGQVVCRTVCVGGWAGGRHPRRVGGESLLTSTVGRAGLFTASRPLAFHIYGFTLSHTVVLYNSTTLFVNVCTDVP